MSITEITVIAVVLVVTLLVLAHTKKRTPRILWPEIVPGLLERRMCKECGYVLHQSITIKNLPGWFCLCCGRRSRDFK